jgi:hypothetical protein
VRRRDIEAQLLDQPGQAWRLALGQVEHQPGKRGGVDDGVLERALEAAPHEPRVEGVVTVLDEHGALRKPQKRAPRVLELRSADEHRAVDVMAFARVRVDRRAAVDESVEEGQRALQREALGPDLQHEEWRVACGLDVERHKLRLFEPGPAPDLRRVDSDLLPRHRLGRPARLQVDGTAHLASASARRAQAISSALTARSSSTAMA